MDGFVMTRQAAIGKDSGLATAILVPPDTLVCMSQSAGPDFRALSESRITNHESRR